jgi:hypothetical protein
VIVAIGLGILLAALASGCAEEPLPQRRASPTDCLNEVRLDRIAEALKRCDAVVAAFPRDPLPLNERYLLHTLANDERSACRDMARATELARAIPAARLDPLLRHDLQRRQVDCREAGLAQGGAGLPALKKLAHQQR